MISFKFYIPRKEREGGALEVSRQADGGPGQGLLWSLLAMTSISPLVSQGLTWVSRALRGFPCSFVFHFREKRKQTNKLHSIKVHEAGSNASCG